MNRRDVVEGLLLGMATGVGILARMGVANASEPTRDARVGRHVVVFDVRFAAARRFAAAHAAHSWIARGIVGDVTPLWHDLLDRDWHRHATLMRGVTTPDSFHCLEQLAADRFWRVSETESDGMLRKWVLAPRRIPS